MHDPRQPIGEWPLKFRYVDVLRRKPEIACKHQRGAAVDRDLQLGPRCDRRPSDPVKGIQHRIAIEGRCHVATKTPRPACASSG